MHAAGGNRGADAVGVGLGIDDRVCGPELVEPVDVAIADDGFAVLDGPPFPAAVEVDRCGEHRVAFDGVKQRRVSIEKVAKTRSSRKERVRRHDQAGFPASQAGEIVERADVLCALPEIEQERMTAFDGSLQAGDQDDAAVCGVAGERSEIELAFVERNRERVVAERRRAIDQLRQSMWNPIEGIVRRVRV